MTEITESAAFMRGRSAFYKVFFAVFREPPRREDLTFIVNSVEYLKRLAEESDNVDLKDGAELLYAASREMCEKTLTKLNIAYTALFLLGRHSIRNTESSFLNKAGLWKQAEWEDVKEIYRLNRFIMPEAFNEPEDHAAMELLFMSALSDLAAKSLVKGDDEAWARSIATQRDFLKRHLLKWLPDFCDKIIGSDTHLMYRSAAMLLKGYLAHDVAVLEELTQCGV